MKFTKKRVDETTQDKQLPLIKVNDVWVKFHQYVALKAVSLTVQRGEIVTLIGPNGAGKSTLLQIVLGLLPPQMGEIIRAPGIRIGYMPQRLVVNPTLPLTVRRFLMLSGIREEVAITAILEEVNALRLLQRPLQKISGGEMQRVLLARALLRQPDLLILDEPIQGVDVIGQYELYELITRIRTQRGCGILMASHDLHLVMAATDAVICLNQTVCCSGHPATVSQHPAYLQLFGIRAARDLAIYTHHHIQNQLHTNKQRIEHE